MKAMRKFKLPELPYAKDGLKSYLSAETLEYHYGKHHKGYVDKLNEMLSADSSTWDPDTTLEEIVVKAQGGLFNQAGQAWNHTFYWYGMTPEQRKPEGKLNEAIHSSFGSFDKFKSTFVEKGMAQFGSGWVWLVKDADQKLEIMTTANAENPLRQKRIPLLVSDVWEHAYYIDFRNERKKYLENFFQSVNWQFVGENFASNRPANVTALMT
jgi:superoxide dismutase, Fe-Mn family